MLNSCILTGNLIPIVKEKDRVDQSNLFSSSGRSRREVSPQGRPDRNRRDSRPAKVGNR